ncbi:MAG: family 43 glycosylhydrolase [Bacteroidales bacterium]|nr:family 43 glycosylhydrolase [Bacteroidales bacterium]
MNRPGIFFLLAILIAGCQPTQETKKVSPKTFCNPLNLSYRFCADEPSRREAADPTMVRFKDMYLLFASKSGGYWYSTDLANWTFIQTEQIPVEEYAPTVVAIKDTLYFLASSSEKNTLYKSADPLSGKWSIARETMEIPLWDPALFLDDDGRLYLYWGCSDRNPLYGVELDYAANFSFIGQPVTLKYPNPGQFGWEVPGDYNTLLQQAPWIEGAWVNKHDGKYYLQYAGPGTEYKSYSDGVYVSDHPLGPFEPQAHNPFAYKPEGFAAGAGHGSTFMDKYGNYWHIGTMTISQKHMFERRLGIFPTFFDEQGTLYSSTKYGDYPLIVPDHKISGVQEIFPGWMLLSYGKKVDASSSIDSLPPSNISDENIRTYWAAASGDKGEYAILDLEHPSDVYALQVNFAEHATELFGRTDRLYHRYTIEYSTDGESWKMLSDKSENTNDNTHVYLQLPQKISCRYLKLTNVKVPDGHFALSGFRIFGKGQGEVPGMIRKFEAIRNATNKRSVILSWNEVENADGYLISYGIHQERLYQSYQVYSDTSLTINSLDAGAEYYFTLESFNENGITPYGQIIPVQ